MSGPKYNKYDHMDSRPRFVESSISERGLLASTSPTVGLLETGRTENSSVRATRRHPRIFISENFVLPSRPNPRRAEAPIL